MVPAQSMHERWSREEEVFMLELACEMIGETSQKDGIQVVH
jgi:hypothetical protein